MRRRIVGSSCAAALLAFAVTALGQTTSQVPTQAPVGGDISQTTPSGQRSGSSARISTDQLVTMVGCVAKARATSPGSGAGGYVLENAVASAENPHPSATTGKNESTPPPSDNTAPAGSATTGASGAKGRSYALTGSTAHDLSAYVGQRVQVVGKIEGGAIGTTGTPTPSDDTAGANGTRMPRVTVTSVRAIAGSCS